MISAYATSWLTVSIFRAEKRTISGILSALEADLTGCLCLSLMEPRSNSEPANIARR
jgi:hypothetical protein